MTCSSVGGVAHLKLPDFELYNCFVLNIDTWRQVVVYSTMDTSQKG